MKNSFLMLFVHMGIICFVYNISKTKISTWREIYSVSNAEKHKTKTLRKVRTKPTLLLQYVSRKKNKKKEKKRQLLLNKKIISVRIKKKQHKLKIRKHDFRIGKAYSMKKLEGYFFYPEARTCF